MSQSRGRPIKTDKRISVTVIVKESVYNAYIKNNRPNNTHNSKIEQFMITDNEAHTGIAMLENKLAEKNKEILEIKATINQLKEQELKINHRMENMSYQRELYSHASNLRHYSNPYKYLPDRAKLLSKKYDIPFSITKADIEALLTHKNNIVENTLEYSVENTLEYSHKTEAL